MSLPVFSGTSHDRAKQRRYNTAHENRSRVALLSVAAPHALQAAQTLDVYVLDVEGGKSVLLVSPSGESMLFDAGWPGYNGRDVNRILQATQAAGVKQIDYLVISHYDIDHLGDVPLLASKIPIKHFVDHGPLQTTRADFAPRYNPYAAVRDKGDYMAVKPGDRIPIKGVDVSDRRRHEGSR
jgi:competence protein ComEC